MKSGIVSTLLIILSFSVSGTVLGSTILFMQAHASDDCEDEAFEKYMKKGEGPYDKYMDRADDVPLPNDEEDVDDYLDDLEPFAEDYINDLEPYAEDYIDDLGDCLN